MSVLRFLAAAPPRPNPAAPPLAPSFWRSTFEEVTARSTLHHDFMRWAEELHLSYARHWDRASQEVVPGSEWAVARIHGEPRNAVLLRWYQGAGGKGSWHPVGAWRGTDLGLLESAQGHGGGAELALYVARLRGPGAWQDEAYSPAGLGAVRAAHRLAVARALVDGRPVPRRVIEATPEAARLAREELAGRLARWAEALADHPDSAPLRALADAHRARYAPRLARLGGAEG